MIRALGIRSIMNHAQREGADVLCLGMSPYMPLTPDEFDLWLDTIRRFSLALIGIGGLIVILIRFVQTGEISLPIFAAFTGVLGLNILNVRKE